MSAKTETRTMADAYGVHCTRSSGKLTLVVNGQSESGRPLKFKLTLPFHRWPCVSRNVKKIWADERADRVMQLNDIDKSMPTKVRMKAHFRRNSLIVHVMSIVVKMGPNAPLSSTLLAADLISMLAELLRLRKIVHGRRFSK